MKNRKTNKTVAIIILLLGLCLLLVIGILIYDIVIKCRRGWNNNDTVQFIFYGFAILLSPYSIIIFRRFLVSNSKEVVLINNDIFRAFNTLEREDKIDNYKNSLIEFQNEKYIERINSILSKRNNKQSITKDNISMYFDEKLSFCDISIKLTKRNTKRVEKYYKIFSERKSNKFEELFRSVHSGELLKKPKFPLFEILLPLFFATFGIFTTIYQVFSTNGELTEPLKTYLLLFFGIILYSILFFSRYFKLHESDSCF